MNIVTDIYKLVGLCSLCFCSQKIMASPWLEADDAFLRSDLIALSDAGSLRTSVSSFPLLWSETSELTYGAKDTPLVFEKEHVLYQRYSAQYNRGNRQLIISACSQCSSEENEQPKAIQVAYEHASNQFAFRVSSKASYDQSDYKVSWDNSYIALNGAYGVLSLGYLDRWWGPTWYHNLVLNSSSKELGLNLNLLGAQTLLGYWSLNSLLTDTEDSDFQYRWANRLQSKPLDWIEYGISQFYWFDQKNHSQSDHYQKLSVDLRVTLPSWEHSPFSHSVYGELATAKDSHNVDAHVLGWSGHFPFSGNSLRLALEKQTVDSLNQCERRLCNGTDISDILYKDSVSISALFQLSNDHQISLVLSKQYHGFYDDEQKARLSYELPVLSGRFELGSSYSSINDRSIWSRYEFRF